MKRLGLFFCAALIGVSARAEAELQVRLGGLAVYDTELDITWLTNGNMNGTMTWAQAVAWADGLAVGGFTDWRLPKTPEDDPTCTSAPPFHGFNCSASEMAHLFYAELGGVAGSSILSSTDPDLALFTNLQAGRYWSGSPSLIYAPDTHSWTFWFESGNEDQTNRSLARYALAVRDGDVISPPSCMGAGGGTYECDLENVTLSGTVSDQDGDLVTYEFRQGATVLGYGSIQTAQGGVPVPIPNCSVTDLGVGVHTIELAVDDGTHDEVTCEILVEVVDTQVPTVAPAASHTLLWPPNHKVTTVTIELNASDSCNGALAIEVTVTSDEPDDGVEDGNTVNDIQNVHIDEESGVLTVDLRAERSGKGDGRVYTICIEVTDASGNSAIVDATVLVPHSKGKGE